MNSSANIEASYIHDTLIKGVFFDNDDVLYRAPENDKTYHQVAAVRAVQQQFPGMGDRQVLRLIEQSKAEGRGSLDTIVEKFAADPGQLRSDHYKQLIKLTKEFPSFFDNDESAYSEIAKLRIGGIETHIITHGNPEWTEYVTSQNDRSLSGFFQNQNYTTKDEMPNHTGKERVDIYERALDKMGVDPEEGMRGAGFAMVEDTMKNLKCAKELGMMTVFINRKNIPSENIPDYVDVTVNTSEEAVQTIISSNYYLELDINPSISPDL